MSNTIAIAIKLLRTSANLVKDAAKAILGNTTIAKELSAAAPLLCGKKIDLKEYELYSIIDWLAKPEGPPPEARFKALRQLLKNCKTHIDDQELEKLFGGSL